MSTERDRTGTAPTAGRGRRLVAGARLGPYRILGFLGAGGMGEVYRARDERLGRDVAVKVLPRGPADEPARLRRFEEEARAAGALNHPNVVAVYDVGDEGDDHFVVAELLEGETLRARLGRGKLRAGEALALAAQIASGLAAAHGKGIVHRDLKPENLFLTTEGRLKILDFGLAKRAASGGEAPSTALTTPGTVLGTCGYMSPEQARGDPTDHRADVFACGAVLYEMLAGRRAFAAASAAETLTAILRDEPPPLRAQGVPAEVDAVIRRCLAKRPEDRFPSAQELLRALEALAAPGAGPSSRARRSVAVLAFRDLSGDPEGERLGLGLADATITELARLRALVVRPTSTILRYQGGHADPRQVGRELEVDAVVEASFQRAAGRLRVTVQVVDTGDGQPLWAGKIETARDDVFLVQDEVSRAIARALEIELGPPRPDAAGRAVGPSAEVYELYLQGKLHLHRETLADFVSAIDWFWRARKADRGFALAWAGLGTAYARLAFELQPEGAWYQRAQDMCERALELDPQLPEGRYLRSLLLWSPQAGFDHAGALRELAAALQARPGLDDALVRQGTVLYHVGLVEEGREALDHALQISPGHLLALSHRAACHYHRGEHAQTLELASSIAQTMPSYWVSYLVAHSHLQLGDVAAAERAVARMARAVREELTFSIRALLAARAGSAAEARSWAERTERHRKAYTHYHHAQYDLACAAAALSRPEEAVGYLRAAAGNGYPCVTLFERDPALDPLRGDPAFAGLLEELRAERAEYARFYGSLRKTSSS